MKATTMHITIWQTEWSGDPTADRRLVDLHNEILELVRRRLANIDEAYRLTWLAGDRKTAPRLQCLEPAE
jgi:hypothetical protein